MPRSMPLSLHLLMAFVGIVIATILDLRQRRMDGFLLSVESICAEPSTPRVRLEKSARAGGS